MKTSLSEFWGTRSHRGTGYWWYIYKQFGWDNTLALLLLAVMGVIFKLFFLWLAEVFAYFSLVRTFIQQNIIRVKTSLNLVWGHYSCDIQNHFFLHFYRASKFESNIGCYSPYKTKKITLEGQNSKIPNLFHLKEPIEFFSLIAHLVLFQLTSKVSALSLWAPIKPKVSTFL